MSLAATAPRPAAHVRHRPEQTLLPKESQDDRFTQVAKAGGFSLHAGVAVQAHGLTD